MNRLKAVHQPSVGESKLPENPKEWQLSLMVMDHLMWTAQDLFLKGRLHHLWFMLLLQFLDLKCTIHVHYF